MIGPFLFLIHINSMHGSQTFKVNRWNWQNKRVNLVKLKGTSITQFCAELICQAPSSFSPYLNGYKNVFNIMKEWASFLDLNISVNFFGQEMSFHFVLYSFFKLILPYYLFVRKFSCNFKNPNVLKKKMWCVFDFES